MRVSDRRQLGRTALEVTIASYGGGSLGNFYRVISDDDAQAILESAWSAGMRYFDTAPFYGRGLGERRIGRFLARRPRDEFVLSSKVGRLLEPARGYLEEDGIFLDPSPFNVRYDYSYDGVMRSHEDSLQRLGMDRIDILYVHDIGGRAHGDEAESRLRSLKEGGLRALEELQSSGAIRGYGLGVTEVEVCRECLEFGNPTAFLLAGRYTLLEQREAKPLLEACRSQGVSLVIGGVFASGILATGPVSGARYDYAPATPDVMERVRRLEGICSSHCVALRAAALQFPLAHPAVATVLIGAGTLRSLRSCIAEMEAEIPAALWTDLAEAGLIDPALAPAAPGRDATHQGEELFR